MEIKNRQISITPKLFNLINIYGISLPIFYKNRSVFTSQLGVILSIISFICIFVYSAILLSRLFLHSSFSILSENNYSGNHFINLTDIPFLFAIINLNGDFLIPNNKYKISISKGSFKSLNDNIIEQIEFENCSNSNYLNQYPNLLKFPISNYLCIKPNQNLSIFGRHGDFLNGFENINIFVNECIDKNCTFDYDININEYLLQIIYVTNIIDHQNYKKPIQTQLREENIFIDTSHFKKYLYYLNPIIYESNNGYLFNIYKRYFSFQFEKLNLEIINQDNKSSKSFLKGNNYTHLLQLAITCSDYPLKISRNYLKVLDVFSIIGGYIHFMFKIFQLITLYFSKKTLFNDIANYLLNKNNTELNPKKFNSSSSNGVFNTINPSTKFNFNSSFLANSNNKKKIANGNIFVKINTKYFNEKKNQENENKFKISCFDYIIPYFCIQKHKKNNFLPVVYNIIKKYLSIEEILPNMERLSRYYKEEKSNLKFMNNFL